MTGTTESDPQVVAWMQRELRRYPTLDPAVLNIGAQGALQDAGRKPVSAAVLASSYEAARKPLTPADIPAGQGAASLHIGPDGDGHLAAWFKTADGRELVMYAPTCTSPGRAAVWDILAAHLPHVTTEGAAPQIRSVDTPDGVRHYDNTGREYRAIDVDGELTYRPTEEA